MSFESLDRRRLLKGAGLTIASLSGCATFQGQQGRVQGDTPERSSSTSSETPTETETASPTDSETETETEAETETSEPNDYPWFHERGTVLADFSNFENNWSVAAGSATAADEGFLTAPAIELSTDGDRRTRIARSFSEPTDLSNRDFSLAVKLLSTDIEMFRVDVMLQDAAGNVGLYSNAILPSANKTWIHFDMAFDQANGSFDPSNVSELWIDHFAGAGDSRFLVDDLRSLPKPETGAVMFTFDDAGAGDYSFALPLLSEFGYSGVAFPPSSYVTETSTPSISDYEEMAADGWDIGGHTPTHQRLSEYSAEEQANLLERNVEELRSKGLVDDEDPLHFRTPYGNYDAATLDVVLDTFDDCIGGAGSAAGTSFHLTDRRMISFRSGEQPKRTKELIDAATEHRQLLGLTFHTKNIDEAYLRSVVEYVDERVRAGDLKVLTMTDFYEASLQ